MFKSKLQELCQRRGWPLPEYSTAKDGPDHIPQFSATVQVNGQPFETPRHCKSSKEAQNLVAQIAFQHFAAEPSPPVQHHHPSLTTVYPVAQPVVYHAPVAPPVPAAYPVYPLPGVPAVPPVLVQTHLTGGSVPTSLPMPGGSVPPSVPIPGGEPPLNLPMPPARFFTARTNLDIKPASNEIMQPNYEDSAQTSMVNKRPLDSADKSIKEMLHLYKNRLQQQAQKKSLSFPVYTSEFEGPPHARRFKSIVFFDGKTYEALEFFPTLKEAENAAAKAACQALSIDEFQEDGGLYKNLLQQWTLKRGLLFPSYETVTTGPSHRPIFVSTVEIGSYSFQGAEAKSKKQAEMNAAKVAYVALTENSSVKEALGVLSSMGHAATSDLEVNVQPIPVLKDDQDVANKEAKNAKRPKTSPENVDTQVTDPQSHNSPPTGASPLSTCVEHSNITEPVTEQSIGALRLPHKKTVVFPRSMSMAIPDEAIMLPYSDNQWVGFKVGHDQ